MEYKFFEPEYKVMGGNEHNTQLCMTLKERIESDRQMTDPAVLIESVASWFVESDIRGWVRLPSTYTLQTFPTNT